MAEQNVVPSELSDKERNIVNLINQLSECASDERSTQQAIDGILSRIRQNTAESVREQMDAAERQTVQPRVEFPTAAVTAGLEDSIARTRDTMLADIAADGDHCQTRQITFTRIREVKRPGKAHPTDAGIDFYIPDEKAWTDEFRSSVMEYSKNPNANDVTFVQCDPDGLNLVVEPGAHVAIPSGIKTIIPSGLGMMFVNKSGIATKLKLDHSACLIDSEYRGEIVMCFFNHGSQRVYLKPGMKITQGLIVPIVSVELQEVLNCVYDDLGNSTDRGGGFGSTGTN